MVHFNGIAFRFAQSLHKKNELYEFFPLWFLLVCLTSSSVADPLIYSHATPLHLYPISIVII